MHESREQADPVVAFARRKTQLRASLLDEDLRLEIIEHLQHRVKEQELAQATESFNYLRDLANARSLQAPANE